jgi:hypothetical protein
MLAIIVSACLIADPNECRDFKIPVDFKMPAKYCAMAAAPVYAQWAKEHPQWEIKRWKCQSATLNDI